MQDLAATAADPVWIVRLRVEPRDASGRRANGQELRRFDELMRRTGGICSPALAVTQGMVAADAIEAVARARALVTSCARRAGLGEVAIDGVEVT